MLPLIEQHRAEIEQLCRRYEVRRLELFGSAARGEFDPRHSDLDFPVLSERPGKLPPDDRYFGCSRLLSPCSDTRWTSWTCGPHGTHISSPVH
jgi:predicted nucleotidyltransferase